jgi:hypothetical protein
MYETLRSLSKWLEVGTLAGEILCKKGCFSTDDMVDNTVYTRQDWKNVIEQDWKLKVQICELQWQ